MARVPSMSISAPSTGLAPTPTLSAAKAALTTNTVHANIGIRLVIIVLPFQKGKLMEGNTLRTKKVVSAAVDECLSGLVGATRLSLTHSPTYPLIHSIQCLNHFSCFEAPRHWLRREKAARAGRCRHPAASRF